MASQGGDGTTREVEGRQLSSEETYLLPVDVPEHDRLTIQHRVIKQALGGLYPAGCKDAIYKALIPKDGVQRHMIDIGSGSGIRSVEAAVEFPHVQVMGFDLVPNKLINPPSNCRFVTGDIKHDVPDNYGKFDVWHSRSIGLGLLPTGYVPYIRTAINGLKPGGLILLGEGDMNSYDEHKAIYPTDLKPGETRYSYFAHLMAVVRDLSLKSLPKELMDTAKLQQFLSEDSDIEGIDGLSFYLPIGWDGPDGTQAEPGELMKKNAKFFVRSWKPALLLGGYDEITCDKWIGNVDEILPGVTGRWLEHSNIGSFIYTE